MLIIDNGFVANIRTLVYQCLDRRTYGIIGDSVAKKMVELSRSHHTLGCIIKIDIDRYHHTAGQFDRLFAERHEQLLHESPVEKSSHAVDIIYLKKGKLAHLDIRMLSGGYEPPLIVLVNKYIYLIVGMERSVDISCREQNLHSVTSVKVSPEIDILDHPQLVVSSYFYHCVKNFLTKVVIFTRNLSYLCMIKTSQPSYGRNTQIFSLFNRRTTATVHGSGQSLSREERENQRHIAQGHRQPVCPSHTPLSVDRQIHHPCGRYDIS